MTAQKLAHVEEAGQGEAEVDHLRNIAKRTTDPWVECFYTNTYSKLLTSSLSAVINSSNLLPSCENDVSKLLLSCRCCYCYIAKCFHQHHSQHQQPQQFLSKYLHQPGLHQLSPQSISELPTIGNDQARVG